MGSRRLLPLVLLLSACGPVGLMVIGLSGGGSGSGLPVAPAAPSGLTATPLTPTGVSLVWTDNATTETGFAVELRRATEPEFAEAVQVGRNTTNFTITGLSPKTGYEFRVQAINSGGQRPSNTAVATTPAQLQLTRLDPDSADTNDTDRVLLHGSGFAELRPGQTRIVRFGGALAQQIDVLDDQTMSVIPAPGFAGSTSVTIENGYESITVPDAFTYFRAPPTFAPNDQRINVTAVGAAGSNDPELACNGRFVYCLWVDRRGGGNTDVFFNRSTDGGASWSTTETRIDTDTPGASNSNDVELAAEGDNVYVVWSDSRNGESDIYFNRSLDHGATWLAADVRLDTDAPGAGGSLDPEICAINGRVYVTWQDTRDGRPHVHFNRSLDAGTTWLGTDLRLDDGQSPTGGGTDPDIRCQGDAVYVVWQDERNGLRDVYFDRSLDGGTSWLPNDVRLDTDPAGSAASTNIEFCVQGENLVAVWYDFRNGNDDIFANRSTDGGASWAANDVRLDTDQSGVAISLNPEICCDGSGVHVVWVDSRDGGSVRSNSSTDSGATWLPTDRRVDSATVPKVTFGAVVGSRGSHVYVAWTDTRAGLFDVHFNDSDDGGVTWRSQDQRLDTNQQGAADSGPPELCVDGARIHCCWLDERDGATTFGNYGNRRVP